MKSYSIEPTHTSEHEQVQEVLGPVQEEGPLQESPTYLLEMICMVGDHSFQSDRELEMGDRGASENRVLASLLWLLYMSACCAVGH